MFDCDFNYELTRDSAEKKKNTMTSPRFKLANSPREKGLETLDDLQYLVIDMKSMN